MSSEFFLKLGAAPTGTADGSDRLGLGPLDRGKRGSLYAVFAADSRPYVVDYEPHNPKCSGFLI